MRCAQSSGTCASAQACFPRSQLDLSCKEAPAHQSGGPVALICASSRGLNGHCQGLSICSADERLKSHDDRRCCRCERYAILMKCPGWYKRESSWHSWSQTADRAQGSLSANAGARMGQIHHDSHRHRRPESGG